jgi:hypothetical protein
MIQIRRKLGIKAGLKLWNIITGLNKIEGPRAPCHPKQRQCSTHIFRASWNSSAGFLEEICDLGLLPSEAVRTGLVGGRQADRRAKEAGEERMSQPRYVTAEETPSGGALASGICDRYGYRFYGRLPRFGP